MEIHWHAPYNFEMTLRVFTKRGLVAPLAALFLIFSGGAAVAPDCHVATTEQIKSQSLHTDTPTSVGHTHSHGPTTTMPSNLQVPLLTLGGGLSNDICFIVGFIVLLLLRFISGARSNLASFRFARRLNVQPRLITRKLANLNLTHLQLGIIRI